MRLVVRSVGRRGASLREDCEVSVDWGDGCPKSMVRRGDRLLLLSRDLGCVLVSGMDGGVCARLFVCSCVLVEGFPHQKLLIVDLDC